jgi:MFS family permease
MAVNLGFSIGPAMGGLLASVSYRWLFIADGLTCIAAGCFFYVYFRKQRYKKPVEPLTANQPITPVSSSPFRDLRFLAFLFFTTCYAVNFFQLFTTLPLYYRDVYRLPELYIGLLLGFNGLLVFLFEMILVHGIEKRLTLWQLVGIGTLLCGFSFVLLNLFSGIIVLLIAVILLTFSEIFAMPFMVTFTVRRAGEGNRGAFIGLYGLSFSAAFILAPYLGTTLITYADYTTLWWAVGIISVPIALGFMMSMRQKT